MNIPRIRRILYAKDKERITYLKNYQFINYHYYKLPLYINNINFSHFQMAEKMARHRADKLRDVSRH